MEEEAEEEEEEEEAVEMWQTKADITDTPISSNGQFHQAMKMEEEEAT